MGLSWKQTIEKKPFAKLQLQVQYLFLFQSCVGEEAWCNGESDCPNGEDESDCPCPAEAALECTDVSGSRICLNQTQICDANQDCADASDETFCGEYQG